MWRLLEPDGKVNGALLRAPNEGAKHRSVFDRIVRHATKACCQLNIATTISAHECNKNRLRVAYTNFHDIRRLWIQPHPHFLEVGTSNFENLELHIFLDGLEFH